MDRVKMFLFARWMATCYADEHCDDKMVDQHTPEFNSKESMSVLNRESGEWWKKQLKEFENTVYPNYVKNGSAENAFKFLHGTELYCSCEKPWAISGRCIVCEKPIKF